jgi:carbon storage regulator
MLVLTRRANESIVIGNDIVVTVLEIKGDQIRLGISAPHEVPVYREELLAALTHANRGAVLNQGADGEKKPKQQPGGATSRTASRPTSRSRVA